MAGNHFNENREPEMGNRDIKERDIGNRPEI
jgi:hypothetical protein